METPSPILSSSFESETEMNFLQNPFSLFSIIEEIVNLQSLFTCGVIVLALLATFNKRCKLTLFRFEKREIVIPTPLQDYSDSDESEASEDQESDEESEYESEYSSMSDEDDEEVETHSFRVAGSDKLKVSLSWSDFVNGRNVVKSWDGLGLGFEKASESLISLWDSNRSEFTSFNNAPKYQIPALSMPSPSVIVSAGFATGKNVALRVFDTRLRHQIPQIFAEWQPCRRKIDSGEVNDEVDVGSVVVRDLRKLDASPVEKLTESDVMGAWGDNGAVVVDGDREISCLGNDNGSVVLRCRNAVFSSLL